MRLCMFTKCASISTYQTSSWIKSQPLMSSVMRHAFFYYLPAIAMCPRFCSNYSELKRDSDSKTQRSIGCTAVSTMQVSMMHAAAEDKPFEYSKLLGGSSLPNREQAWGVIWFMMPKLLRSNCPGTFELLWRHAKIRFRTDFRQTYIYPKLQCSGPLMFPMRRAL